MDGFNELQKIWLSADTTALPDGTAMMRAIRVYSRKMLFKKVGLVLLGALLIACMTGVIFLYRSVMLTTRLGESCIIAACFVFIVANARSLGRVYRLKDYSNKDFIFYLEHLRTSRLRYYRKTQVLGLFLASLGLALYILEPVRTSVLLCLISYLLLAGYILFMWLVVRPRAFRRQARKLEETIKEMRRLTDQL